MLTSRAGRRLITQNLLAGGALLENKSQPVTWDIVGDLSILIDIFCLYDTVEVMGRQAYSMLPKAGSEFYGALDRVLKVDEVRSDKVLAAACAHLVAFIGENRSVDEFEPLFRRMQHPDSIERAYSPSPDGPDEVTTGKLWLQTLPDGADIVSELDREPYVHRSVTFLARTFVYLAQADASGLVLTPDRARSEVLEAVTNEEKKLRKALRAQILEKMNEAFQDSRLGDELNVTRDITPLAAIVFGRASPRRSNIPREMVRLRDELEPLRTRLRGIEEELFWGKRDTEVAAFRKWQGVFEEIEREFGKGDSLVNISGGLSFAEGVAGAAVKPHEPKGWFQLLSLPIDVVRRILRRRTIVELRHLRSELPASDSLWRKVEWLLA
jgi:hypothetical protein